MYVEKEPLVMGPTIHKLDVFKCLSCYAELTKDCKTHGPECDIIGKFFKMKVSFLNYKETGANYIFIIGLRALALKTRNPSAYSKLMKLQDRATKGSFQEFLTNTVKKSYEELKSMILEKDTSIFSELSNINPVLVVNRK